VVAAVLGKAARRRIEVAPIERFVELLCYAPIGLGDVHGSLSYRSTVCE
jgi:hypothetical protein